MSRIKDYLLELQDDDESQIYEDIPESNLDYNEDSFDHEAYLSSITEEIIPKYKNVVNKFPMFPKNNANIKFKNINLNNIDLSFKLEYLAGKISPEDFVIKYYEELNYNALFTENNYWVVLFILYYFDDLELNPTFDLNFELNETQLHKKLDFKKVLVSDNINQIIQSYISYFYTFIARDSERYLSDYFSVEELLIACIYLNPKQLSLIFERLWTDFNYFKTGFPDLIVYNDEEFFFVEVKSKNDNPSFKQIQWHKFLVEVVNVDVVLFSLDKNSNQLDFLKNKYDAELLNFKNQSKDNKLYLKPLVTNFTDYETETLFLTYNLKHSSGKGEKREYIEIIKLPATDENTPYSAYKDIIDISEDNKHKIYKRILKQCPPRMFVDYRPTRNQLKRNKDAELLEGQGRYDDAIKLYEKNVSERCGSPTTYKQLIKIYRQLNNPSRILEIIEIAMPIFTTLNNESMVLSLVYYKNEAIYQKEDIKYLKVISLEENDYLYENCCVNDGEKFVLEKIEELESNATGDYSSGGYWIHYI